MSIKPDEAVIFTDGASRGNPGPGGFAAIVIASQNSPNCCFQIVELGGREEDTTNNRMELAAAIEAFSFLDRRSPKAVRHTLYTDSSYLLNGITKWVYGWRKNGWLTKAKAPVENRDLWERLIEVTEGKEIQWRYVGGHLGIAGNERCDQIATAFADGESPKLYDGPFYGYPIENILDPGGSLGNVSQQSEERIEAKKRKNAKAHSYVSRVEGLIKIHKSWAECEVWVKGKSGAKYKKALNAADERRIIEEFKGLDDR